MSQRIFRRGLFLPLSVLVVMSISCSENTPDPTDGLYARLNTSRGTIILELYPDEAPLTVMNFVGLAEGALDFADREGPFYDGLTFHRVIEDFMIQGGDPQGSGSGGPGYSFPDETDNGLIFDSPGILAMANAGPDTNGSQFFITRVVTDWLNGNHTIFGRVSEGQDIVEAMRQGDTITTVEILRIGSKAEAYTADSKRFRDLEKNITRRRRNALENSRKETMNQITDRWPDAVLDEASGIYSLIRREGSGPVPSPGTSVSVHYTGSLMDDTVFDSSRDRNAPFEFKVGTGQVIPGWDTVLLAMKKGGRRTVILPPEMAYGKAGVGPIPPNSWLIFDIELLDIQGQR